MFTLTGSSKPKVQLPQWENPIEAIRDFSDTVAHTAKQEGKNLAQDALKQILALESDVKKLSGDLHAGESIDLSNSGSKKHKGNEAEIKGHIQPGLSYHHEFASLQETRISKEDTGHVQVRIDQILVELKNLANSSQELAVQFEEITMEQAPENAGTYHLNFFEWVFSVIRKARERIEESQTWLSMFKSKKGDKTYWNMFEKHGTTFGLSGERAVSTQTG